MKINIHLWILAAIVITSLFVPETIIAQEGGFVPLNSAGIPGLDPDTDNVEGYINALYVLSIGLASVLAVVKIILAGVQYMLSDVVTNKAQAKKDILGALLGLVLILGAVTILNTINTDLVKFNIFDENDAVTYTVGNSSGRCPAGQIFLECWSGSGGAGAVTGGTCSDPNDTSWCDGEIFAPEDESDLGVISRKEVSGSQGEQIFTTDCTNKGGEAVIDRSQQNRTIITCYKVQ